MTNRDISELPTTTLIEELEKRLGVKTIPVGKETEYNVIVNPIGKALWDPAIRTDDGEDPTGPVTILIFPLL